MMKYLDGSFRSCSHLLRSCCSRKGVCVSKPIMRFLPRQHFRYFLTLRCLNIMISTMTSECCTRLQ